MVVIIRDKNLLPAEYWILQRGIAVDLFILKQ